MFKKIIRNRLQKENNELSHFIENRQTINPKAEAFNIIIVYGVFGVIWIMFSDEILFRIITDPLIYKNMQTYKGWLYVLVTIVMIYFLVRSKITLFEKAINKIFEGYEELNATFEELTATEEELRSQYSELEEYKEALLIKDQRYELVVEGANDGIWDWDLKDHTYYFSLKWKGTFGYGYNDLDNDFETWKNLLHPDDQDSSVEKIETYLSSNQGIYENTYRLRCKDGSYRWVLSRGKAIWDDNGEAIRVAGSHTDITEKKIMEIKLHSLAYYDTITNLPNRAMFEREMNTLINVAKHKKLKFALINMDIDNFKHINDVLGHNYGDVLLKNITNILMSQISSPNLAARIGGDEFAIILKDINEKNEVIDKIEELTNAFKKTWTYNDQNFIITFSIGIALFPEHGDDLSTLLKNSDTAMFNMKEKGKNGYCFFTDEIHEKALNHAQMINEIRDAIENREFTLHYQPQIDLKSGELIGVEALIRWIHPQKGFISPMEFIPIAESTGQVREISKWVLETAFSQKQKWDEQGYSKVQMSVNLSAISLNNTKIIDEIKHILLSINTNTINFNLEITETAIMSDVTMATNVLNQLRDIGIEIALDDFGTGYSSLTYLKRLPISIIKLDRDFIKNIETNNEDELIVKSVIQLSHNLKLEVVAEGIETEEQLMCLQKYKCDIGQGYLFSKPVPVEEINLMLESGHKFKIR